jgi:hypothetical protein
MSVIVSEVDVDGIIAIGKLPLVRCLDKGSIDLNDLKLFPITDKLKSASINTKIKYGMKSTLYIGNAGGIPYFIVTALSAQDLQLHLLQFIAQSKVSDIGFVNGWLSIGIDTVADLRDRIATSNCSTVVVNVQFLKCFSNWLLQFHRNDSELVQGGLFWFGMRMPEAIFFSNFKNNVCREQLMESHVHLAIEIRNSSDVPCIVTLNPELRAEFPGDGTQWFHPLGLSDGVNITSKPPSKLVLFHQKLLLREINSIRIYQPELMHCRTPEIRLQRAVCAAAAVIGGSWVQSGFYKDKCQSVCRWAHCIETGLYGVYCHGSALRVEYSLPLRPDLGPLDTLAIRQKVKLFFTGKHRLNVTPTREIPYHELILPAIGLVKSASIHNLKEVVAAEAYLGFLIDGGALRIYYPGLKAALGMTITNALNTDRVIAAPKSLTFDSTTWDDLYINRLAIPVAYFLKISATTALQMLTMIVEKYPCAAPLTDKSHGIFWIGMVKLLLSIDTGNQINECWHVSHHQRKGQLFATISPESLAIVLLHERPTQSHNKLRVLVGTLIRSYLDRSFPRLTEEDKKYRLELLIREQLHVFPHSLPISGRDRTERWWRVGSDPDAKLLENTFQWMANKLPRTLENVPTLTRVTTDSDIVSTGWFLINRFLESQQNIDFKCNTIQQFFRAIWVVILATAIEQTRRNNFRFHPYLAWGEWRIEMQQHLDQIFRKCQEWNILIVADTEAPHRETLFTLWQVPSRMPERLEHLREIFVTRGIIPRPQGTNQAALEIEPIDDGIPAGEIDDGVPPPIVVKKRRRHTDVTIALQEEIQPTRTRF